MIDTSALVAILFDEPEAEQFAKLIRAAEVRRLSIVNRLELSIVLEGRHGCRRARHTSARPIGAAGFAYALAKAVGEPLLFKTATF